LVKPQFEAGREQVGKKGIVRDPRVHEAVLDDIIAFSVNEGYDVCNLSYSPITGGDGNIEFLLHLFYDGTKEKGELSLPHSPARIVAEAHQQLKNKDHGNEGE